MQSELMQSWGWRYIKERYAVSNHLDGMKETLETINRMQADGVIEEYAVGGIVGDTFYLEPAATLDVDVFVTTLNASENWQASLKPVYEYLARIGCKPDGGRVMIGSWPVKFLTPANALENEAVSEAVHADAGGVPTRVMTAEHLVAIALQSARPKDLSRVIRFIEHEALEQNRLECVLAHHELTAKWEKFNKEFFND